VTEITLALPWPPSANQCYRLIRSGKLMGRVLMSAEGRAYRKAVDAVVRQAKGRMCWATRLRVEILAYPPDRRARDIDNLFKAVLDALQASGVFLNDAQIDQLEIMRGEPVKGGSIVARVEQLHQPVSWRKALGDDP
jgi:crossover junction endodeoxyribonuclease RusA